MMAIMSDLLGSVENSLAVDASKYAISLLSQYLSRWRVDVSSSQERLEAAIGEHQREVKSWSEEISFKDLLKPKATSEVFVPLDIYLLPRRQRFSAQETLSCAPMSSILESEDVAHLVILGQPGAGKTTAVKHLCQQMLKGDETSPLQDFPLLIRLRDMNNAKSASGNLEDLLIERIQSILDIPLSFPTDLESEDSSETRRSLRERAVIQMLETLRPLVLLDGLDEISHKARRDSIIAGARRLAIQLERARIILTARTGEFSYHIEKMTTYEIAPLSQDQIEKFASGWLGTEDAKPFLKQVRNSPFADTAIKPLTLAHLCAIFERVHRIPEKPKSVYRKIVSLLLEDWDQQRSVQRVSSYSDFEVDRKAEFLSDLAHSLTTSNKTSTFTRYDLLESYRQISANYGLRSSEAQAVVNELETHTGLIVQSGTDLFEFSHKSLQEYLTAVFIVGLPGIPRSMIDLQIMPNELAIATALSSRPSQYFYSLVMYHFSQIQLSFQFVRTFINRMLIERPDFEVSDEVGLAILCLYSQYLRASIEEASQLQLFTYDPLSEEFEHLNTLIKERIRISDLLGVYQKHSHSYGLDGQEIWRMEVKQHREGPFRVYAGMRALPEILWVRKTLVDETPEPLLNLA
jgi:energy-coupling factor transporter ATP-binding protein EcfA2